MVTIKGKITKLNTGQDTIKVEVDQKSAHPLYGKLLKKFRYIMAHLEETKKSSYELGQEVKLQQVKPISKNKNWIVVS